MESLLWMLCVLAGLDLTGGENVTCLLFEECVLPCKFPAHPHATVAWTQLVKGSPMVATHDVLQGGEPDIHPLFTGRAGLAPDWSTSGNASLRLRPVSIQDQGKYLCQIVAGTVEIEARVHLALEAPVSNLLLRLEGNSLSCSSEDLYPVPQLHWSTQPPSNTSHHHTTVLQTQQQLYNISSSLTLPADQRHLVVTCTVSYGGKKRKTATWRLLGPGSSPSELTFSCPAHSGPPLVWMFNHSEVIASLSGASYRVTERWRKRVANVSLLGNLTLKDWNPLDGEEIVTCRFKNGTKTIDHFVKFLQEPHSVFLNVFLTVMLVVAAGVFLGILARKALNLRAQSTTSETEVVKRPLDFEDNDGPLIKPGDQSDPDSPSTPSSTGSVSPLTQQLPSSPQAPPSLQEPFTCSSNQDSHCRINIEPMQCRFRTSSSQSFSHKEGQGSSQEE